MTVNARKSFEFSIRFKYRTCPNLFPIFDGQASKPSTAPSELRTPLRDQPRGVHRADRRLAKWPAPGSAKGPPDRAACSGSRRSRAPDSRDTGGETKAPNRSRDTPGPGPTVVGVRRRAPIRDCGEPGSSESPRAALRAGRRRLMLPPLLHLAGRQSLVDTRRSKASAFNSQRLTFDFRFRHFCALVSASLLRRSACTSSVSRISSVVPRVFSQVRAPVYPRNATPNSWR